MNDIEIMQELRLNISRLEEENKQLKEHIVERDTPKKPIYNNLTLEYHCPVCSYQIEPFEWIDIPRERWTFCAKCGQRLDWSDYDVIKKIKSIIETNKRYKFIYVHPKLWDFFISLSDISVKNGEHNLYNLKLDTLYKLQEDEILLSEFNLKEFNLKEFNALPSNHVYVRRCGGKINE